MALTNTANDSKAITAII